MAGLRGGFVMGFHRIDDVPDVRLAHLVGRDTHTEYTWSGTKSVLTSRYLTYPIGARRPAEGSARHRAYCDSCRAYVAVSVPSARLARREQRIWLVPLVILLCPTVAAVAFILVRGTEEAVRHGFSLGMLCGGGGLLVIVLGLMGYPLIKTLEQARTAHGVAVAKTEPRTSRSVHSIRRPAGQARTAGPATAPRPSRQPGRIRSAAPEPRPETPSRSGAADDTTVVDHPVFRLRTGTDRATVLARLGPPPESPRADAGGDEEVLRYPDSLPDHDISVVLAGGVLARVEIARKEAGQGRIVIAADGVHASTPGHAFLALTAMLEGMPAIDSARLQQEYAQARQSWSDAPGKVGLLTAVANLLLADLTGDAAVPGHTDFLLRPMPDRACVQVVSIVDRPGHPIGLGIAYRVWRMADGIQWALIRSKPRGAQR